MLFCVCNTPSRYKVFVGHYCHLLAAALRHLLLPMARPGGKRCGVAKRDERSASMNPRTPESAPADLGQSDSPCHAIRILPYARPQPLLRFRHDGCCGWMEPAARRFWELSETWMGLRVDMRVARGMRPGKTSPQGLEEAGNPPVTPPSLRKRARFANLAGRFTRNPGFLLARRGLRVDGFG